MMRWNSGVVLTAHFQPFGRKSSCHQKTWYLAKTVASLPELSDGGWANREPGLDGRLDPCWALTGAAGRHWDWTHHVSSDGQCKQACMAAGGSPLREAKTIWCQWDWLKFDHGVTIQALGETGQDIVHLTACCPHDQVPGGNPIPSWVASRWPFCLC